METQRWLKQYIYDNSFKTKNTSFPTNYNQGNQLKWVLERQHDPLCELQFEKLQETLSTGNRQFFCVARHLAESLPESESVTWKENKDFACYWWKNIVTWKRSGKIKRQSEISVHFRNRKLKIWEIIDCWRTRDVSHVVWYQSCIHRINCLIHSLQLRQAHSWLWSARQGLGQSDLTSLETICEFVHRVVS